MWLYECVACVFQVGWYTRLVFYYIAAQTRRSHSIPDGSTDGSNPGAGKGSVLFASSLGEEGDGL